MTESKKEESQRAQQSVLFVFLQLLETDNIRIIRFSMKELEFDFGNVDFDRLTNTLEALLRPTAK